MKDVSVTWKTQRDEVLDPADPLAEDTNRTILVDIRSDWLTTAASAQPESRLIPARFRKVRPLVKVDYLALVKSGIASILGIMISLVRELSDSLREKAKGSLLLVFLATVMIVGALVYAVVVDFVLDPTTVPDIAQAGTSQAPRAAHSPFLAVPASAADSTDAATSSSSDTPGAAQGAGAIHANESPVPALDQAIAVHISNSAEISGQNDQRASKAEDDAVTLTKAADTMAHKARDAIQLATQPLPPEQAPAITANTGATKIQRTPSRAAYKQAVQAEALNPGGPPALEPMQVLLAASRYPGAAQAAALESIAHGGQAVFELQYLGAQATSLQPARIAITATTLQFIPEAAGKAGAFSIPLASITSVQIGPNITDRPGLYHLTINFHNSKDAAGQLLFTGASYRPESSTAERSQFFPSQQTGLFTAIRNVILTTQSRSRLVPVKSAFR